MSEADKATAQPKTEEEQKKATIPTLEEFVNVHKDQLESLKIPKLLWKVIHRKLFAPKLIQDEDIFELDHLPEGGYQLKAKKALRRNGDVYIIPHACEGDDISLYNLFKVAPGLVEYLAEMIDLDKIKIDPNEEMKQLKEKAVALVQKVDTIKEKRMDGIDEDMITMVMEQGDVTRLRAEQALMEFQGDVVAAIADCLLTPQHKAIEANMNKNLFSGQKNVKGEEFNYDQHQQEEREFAMAQAEAEKARELIRQLEEAEKARTPLTDEEKQLQRVAFLYQCLFKNHFVNVYYSMKPRGPDSPFTGPIQPEEIVKNYYVMESMGSAIIGAAEPNCALECFICLSSGNTSWSLLIPTRDIKAGEIITRPPIRAIQCPLEFKW